MTHVKEKRCARQNCSYRRRHGQKFNLGLSDIFKMVDRSGSVGHTHLHSARAMKLIGMQTRSDAITGGFIKILSVCPTVKNPCSQNTST